MLTNGSAGKLLRKHFPKEAAWGRGGGSGYIKRYIKQQKKPWAPKGINLFVWTGNKTRSHLVRLETVRTQNVLSGILRNIVDDLLSNNNDINLSFSNHFTAPSTQFTHPQECFLRLWLMLVSCCLHTLPHRLAQQILLLNLPQILVCLLALFLHI